MSSYECASQQLWIFQIEKLQLSWYSGMLKAGQIMTDGLVQSDVGHSFVFLMVKSFIHGGWNQDL